MKKDEFKIQEQTPDQKLVKMISKKRPHLKKDIISDMLKYNVLTSSQLGSLTGKRPDAIITMSTLKIKGGKVYSGLTRVLPFKEVDENGDLRENTKKTFILIDEKCLNFILANNR